MPTEVKPTGSLCDLLDQLHIISNESLDELSEKSSELTTSLLKNRLRGSLYEVLEEVKERTVIKAVEVDDRNDGELNKLNSLLMAEGIMIRPDGTLLDSDTPGCDQLEYREEMQKLRQRLHAQIEKKNMDYEAFIQDLRVVMENQQKLRPITEKDIERMINNIRKYSFNEIEIKIKNKLCKDFMGMRTKLLDARRKRKNFPKNSTAILNQYFESNLDHPYPSEETKVELARKCNISVAQVSNWFGNKRIRFKKRRVAQDQQGGPSQAQMMAMQSQNVPLGNMAPAMNQPNPMMLGYPGMFNPYPGMFPGAPNMPMGPPGTGFDLSAYQPQMMLNNFMMPSADPNDPNFPMPPPHIDNNDDNDNEKEQ